jgi:hypothetical protein
MLRGLPSTWRFLDAAGRELGAIQFDLDLVGG